MSYNDDPNINKRHRVADANRNNTGMWVAGAAVLALIIGLFAWNTGRDSTVATNRPAVTTPATTTGAGDRTTAPATAPRPSTIPANPSGTTPQTDTNQPVPQVR